MIGFRSKKTDIAAASSNLLDMVPVLTDRISSVQQNEHRVSLVLPRRSWLERQSVKWLKQPEAVQVHLDDLGSAVVLRCKGDQTVGQIAEDIRQEFGEAAEPLLPRLAKFMEVLEANGLLALQPSETVVSGQTAAR